MSEEVRKWYHTAIGKLLYLCCNIRLEIMFSVIMAAKYVSDPTPRHVVIVKRIIRYLKGVNNDHLFFSFSKVERFDLKYFCDSSWIAPKYFSGSIIILNGAIVSWLGRQQKVPGLSSSEAE